MPITFVAAGTASTGNNVGLTPALPAGFAANDLLIAVFSARGAGTINTPSGWTALSGSPFSHSSSGINEFHVVYKIAAGGDSAPVFTYTGGASGDTTIAQTCALRGVNTTTPIDVVGTASSNAAAANIGPISAVAGVASDCALIVAGHRADDSSGVDLLTGDSLTWTEIGDTFSSGGFDATLVWDVGIAVGTPTITSKTFTVNGGISQTGLGVMWTVKAAAGGAPQPPVMFIIT